jgi:hypothetical protein
MPSTILSSLGEPVLHSNSLATVTCNWIVVREASSGKQSIVSIDSIAAVKTFKTTKILYVACGLGCLVMSIATMCSKQADGATFPFSAIGLTLLGGAQLTRQASVAIQVDSDIVQTAYGNLREAATLMAAIRSAQQGWRHADQPGYTLYAWIRAYIALLV